MIRWCGFVWLLVFSFSCKQTYQEQKNYDQIVADFIQPSSDNRLWCYWYWVGDDVSKEGITKDLEAMKSAGIGAALIGNINPDEVDGNVPLLSEKWWDCMVHAVNEGKRIGVDIGVFNCPGWSQSGGPWISAEKAMRYLNYSETIVTGGRLLRQVLEKPNSEFQDLRVLAFPLNSLEKHSKSQAKWQISISPQLDIPESLLDGDTKTGVFFTSTTCSITMTQQQPICARRLVLYPKQEGLSANCELWAQIEGRSQLIKTFRFDRSNLALNVGAEATAPVSIALPDVKARQFKLVCKDIAMSEQTGFSEIELSEVPIIEHYVEKHLGKMHPTPQPQWNTYSWPISTSTVQHPAVIQGRDVIDVSSKMDKRGMIAWNVPQGEWVIMRIGLSPTGTMNAPAAPQGKGYEVDKMNEAFVRFHFDHFVGEFLRRIPDGSKSAFKYVVADSYEMGAQNWTDGFEKRFERTYGYDPIPYLPVLSGRVVGNEAMSDRFLWDLRRAIADDVAYNYCGGLRKVSHENGLQLWLENYGHWGFPSEFLMYGGQSDYVSGEYWNEGTLGNIECKAASSAAHIYGKGRVSAECFTAAHRSYVRHPALLKKRGDWAMTEGINHHVLHLYIHQPDDQRQPGVNAWFSTEFNRHNTWFKQGKAFFDYLRRCQHMLQLGTYVADVCYFIGEDAPIMTGACVPELPEGYAYDYINAEVILRDLTVQNGRFVLPDGMNYKVLVLPPLKTMRPDLLTKLRDLIAMGGIVYGSAPLQSPSLEHYPQCDQVVRELSEQIWHSTIAPIKPLGKGAVVEGMSLTDLFTHLSLEKDVIVRNNVLWIHRKLDDMDIYFLTNQSGEDIDLNPSFSISNKKAQLWDAEYGTLRALHTINQEGRTQLSLRLNKDQSCFVVFTDHDNPYLKPSYEANTPTLQPLMSLSGDWTVHFQSPLLDLDTLLTTNVLFDWAQHKCDAIKYYSGTASYQTTFALEEQVDDVILDLGKVGVMAQVKINGKALGTSWIAPHHIDISTALHLGVNTLNIDVVNTWRNSLTGERLLPEKQRRTWTCVDVVGEEERLLPSGLIGPVKLYSVH